MSAVKKLDPLEPPRVVIVHHGDRIDCEWGEVGTPQRAALILFALEYAKARLLRETCDLEPLAPTKEPL